ALPAKRSRTTYGNGTLSFAYQGWTTQEQTDLERFITIAYPRLVNIYGAPADTRTLTLIKGSVSSNGYDWGEYDPVANTLTLEPLPEDFTTGDFSQYGLSILHQILHAFRAPAIINFDAWEEGMAWAAAMVTMNNIYPELFSGGTYPMVNHYLYLLPLYDMLNQPPLATPSFFPDGNISSMSIWRLGMATSGWLKVYTENPSFFSAFNNAYYLQYSTNPAAGSDLTTLKSLVASTVPTVENETFQLWYDHQYALKPVATIGNQFYIFTVPLPDNTGDGKYSISMLLYYYRNDVTGSGITETPLTGTATLDYTSYDHLPLYPEEGNQVSIGTDPNLPAGTGNISPTFVNIGEIEQQRIRISTTIPGLAPIITYFPYAVAGQDGNENQFFGVTIGADDGTLHINMPNSNLADMTVIQGSFSQKLPFGDIASFAKTTIVYTAADNTQKTYYRNVGPGFYVPILTVGSETQGSLTHTFAPGLAMVSFPITPTDPDAGVLLGFGADSPNLQLSWYDPSTLNYRTYPAIPSLIPGRGFWLKLASLVTANVSGAIPSPDSPLSITLDPGWNMIGNAFNSALDPWSMSIEAGSVNYRMTDAVSQQIVGPAWTYDTVGGSYTLSNGLQSWEGAWVYNNTGGPLTLVQTPPSKMAVRAGRSTALATQRSVAAGDFVRRFNLGGWSLALRANAPNSRDFSTYLGVAPTAKATVDGLDWVKPPAVGNGVRAALVHPGAPTAGAAYATDIRGSIGTSGESWTVQVTTKERGQVTLSWPNLRNVPPQYELTLEDLSSGALRYMRTAASYQFQSSGTPETPDVRSFRVTVRQRGDTPLKILSMSVAPMRGAGGLNVNVTLSSDADLVMDVRTTTGRLIRTVTAPATRGMAPAMLSWNGRDNEGRIVPSGMYLLAVRAQTPTGYSISRTSLGVLKQQ
ncbi:MAG TPA: hypothetical protein VGM23_05000, partial [Armatimonadota bacterium]